MATKRASQESDDRDLQVASKRRHGNPEQAETVQNPSFLTARSFNATNDYELRLESVIRKVMEEVLQRHLAPCRGLNLNQQADTSRGKPLQLCFTNQLPPKIYTRSSITAEGGAALQFELCDATNQQRIVRDEYSSMKILLCVLHGDFGSNAKEDWTAEEFDAQIVSPRQGKGLLNGKTVITLENGVGYIDTENMFNDNSCWEKSKMFRLGLKINESTSTGADIREGRSDPFRVLDRRGKASEKHDPPSLDDEVWRLKHIGGKLAKKLSQYGIKTVKDFRQSYITDQASLREKMGKITEESWNTIIKQAERCAIDDDERYMYNYNAPGQKSLNLEEERLVERVKQQAYNNLEDLKPLGPDQSLENLISPDTKTSGLVRQLTGVQPAQYSAPDQGLPQLDFSIDLQDFDQLSSWAEMLQYLNEESGGTTNLQSMC